MKSAGLLVTTATRVWRHRPCFLPCDVSAMGGKPRGRAGERTSAVRTEKHKEHNVSQDNSQVGKFAFMLHAFCIFLLESSRAPLFKKKNILLMKGGGGRDAAGFTVAPCHCSMSERPSSVTRRTPLVFFRGGWMVEQLATLKLAFQYKTFFWMV